MGAIAPRWQVKPRPWRSIVRCTKSLGNRDILFNNFRNGISGGVPAQGAPRWAHRRGKTLDRGDSPATLTRSACGHGTVAGWTGASNFFEKC